MVKLGVGFKCSDREKETRLLSSQRAGWVELRPRTAVAEEGRVSELLGQASGRLLLLRKGASVAPALLSPRTKCQGEQEQSDSRGVICIKRPSLTWELETSFKSILSARSTGGGGGGTQRWTKPGPPPARTPMPLGRWDSQWATGQG